MLGTLLLDIALPQQWKTWQSEQKNGTTEILRALETIGCNSDAQIVPTLLYAAEIWGYKKL